MWNIFNYFKFWKKHQVQPEPPKPPTMRDPISIARINALHPKVRAEVMQILLHAESKFPPNVAIRVVQGFRTWEEQDALYQQGRTRPGKIVTNARAGSSYHNFGLAIDFALLYDKNGDGRYEELSWDTVKDFDRDGFPDWNEVVASFEAAGWEWGGRWRTFKDLPHCQKTFGYKVSTLKDMYLRNRFIMGTRYVAI